MSAPTLSAPGTANHSVIGERLQPFVDDGSMAGAVVAIGTKDAILAEGAVGYANLEKRTPMAMDSLFWIASMSKPMTATAFMMLVDEGKVHPDDRVDQYIPDFTSMMVETPDGPVQAARPLQIRDLLTHTSGLPFASPAESPTYDLLSLSRRASEYARLTLQSQPGEKYAYSNAGINTVGRIIEIVSGMSYERFMEERIFRPLHMVDTTFLPNQRQIDRLALTYKSTEDRSALVASHIGQLHYPLDDSCRTPMPAGGLFSTAADVMAFCQMIASGGIHQGTRLISRASIATMTSRQTPDWEKTHGFGWNVTDEMSFHGGAFQTSMSISRDEAGLITIFLIQQDGPWAKNGGDLPAVIVAIAEALRPGRRQFSSTVG